LRYCFLVTSPAANTEASWTARARARYTDPAAAKAALEACKTEIDRLFKARQMLRVARRPEYRFGLVASDVSTDVVGILESTISELVHVGAARDANIRALAAHHAELEAQGHAQDEVWNILEDSGSRDLGFRYGDSAALRAIR
jgi:hypothetical protein